MFKSFAKSAVAGALALTVLAATAPVQSAHAGNSGAALVGGFVAGAIVGGALAQPRGYYAPAPAQRYHHPVRAYGYRPAPWSPEWYRYCSARYRSFDPRSGYFLAYSGEYRFCR